MAKLPTDIAIFRKPNGPFLWTRSGVMLESPTPKYLPTMDRAMMAVRIDMGLNLSDVEFMTRRSISERAHP